MKQAIVLIIALGLFTFQLNAQNTDSSAVKKLLILEADSTTYINDLGEKKRDNSRSLKSQDTTKLILGRKSINIIEKNDETKIDIYDNEHYYKRKRNYRRRFAGHWAAIDFGINNFMDKEYSITRLPEHEYLNLNTGKSYNVNVNFAQYSIGIIGRNVGLVTGLGFEFNDYKFENMTSLQVVGGMTVPDSTYLNGNLSPVMSKLSTGYFTVPLLLEFQSHINGTTIYIAAGVIGGIKTGSHTKVKYGNDDKEKKYEDFNINPFRYEFTARIGINNFGIYALYSPVSFFEKDRGPELNPFSIGLSFNFND